MGKIEFEGPYSTSDWAPPNRAAVYAIMRKPDPQNKPHTYRMLYFGESDNLSDRGFWRAHYKYESFKDHAGSDSKIYIGVHRMPNSTTAERKALEKKLVTEYNPICNR